MQITENIETGVIVSITVTDGDNEWTLENITDTVQGEGVVIIAFGVASSLPRDVLSAIDAYLMKRYDIS